MIFMGVEYWEKAQVLKAIKNSIITRGAGELKKNQEIVHMGEWHPWDLADIVAHDVKRYFEERRKNETE